MIYRDETGMKLMRPPGTHYESGLMDWIQAIPEEKRGSIVEIGSYAGESAVILARYFGAVLCVDPWQDVDHIYQAFLERTNPYRNIDHHRGYSVEVSHGYPAASFDVAYIDGNHRRRAVDADIQAWLQKTRWYIGGHDYVEGSDVQIAVDRWCKGVQTFEDYSWLHKIA